MVEFHLAKVVVEGSIPFSRSIFCGGVAQLVEQLTLNQWVLGSIPGTPTIWKVFFSVKKGTLFLFLD